jgi:hypothetical protein
MGTRKETDSCDPIRIRDAQRYTYRSSGTFTKFQLTLPLPPKKGLGVFVVTVWGEAGLSALSSK